jgi:thymidylate kinase
MSIISFSGIDGSGKGTQINLIETYLRNNNIRYITIWARGSWTPGMELLKKIVRQDRGFSEEQKAEYRKEARTNPKKQKLILILSILDLFWFFGLYYRLISLSGKVLICDRYIWDTVVDFRVNFSRYKFEKWFLWKLLIKLVPTPNPSFVFVITAEHSIKRGLLKQEAHMEDIDTKTLKSIEYNNLIRECKWSKVIDGNLESNIIHEQVKERFKNEN